MAVPYKAKNFVLKGRQLRVKVCLIQPHKVFQQSLVTKMLFSNNLRQQAMCVPPGQWPRDCTCPCQSIYRNPPFLPCRAERAIIISTTPAPPPRSIHTMIVETGAGSPASRAALSKAQL